MTLDPRRRRTRRAWQSLQKMRFGRWRLKWCWDRAAGLGHAFAASFNVGRYQEPLHGYASVFGRAVWLHGAGSAFRTRFRIVVGLVVGLCCSAPSTRRWSDDRPHLHAGARPRNAATVCQTQFPRSSWQPLLVAAILPIILSYCGRFGFPGRHVRHRRRPARLPSISVRRCFNKRLKLNWREFMIMVVTFAILFAIEITIAKTKPAALFFATCVLLLGFGLRGMR